jgi:hypothetical protein
MKAQNNIKGIKIYGNLVLMDYEKEQIIFPDDSLTQKEIESIACYLSEEGFLEEAGLNSNN